MHLGKNVVIEGDVSIGEGTVIEDNVVIVGPVRIGRNNHIFHNTVIGLPPQDLKYQGEETEVIIGDNNIIREFVSIHRATGEGNRTVIGNNNFIMAYVHIAHNCIIGNHTIIVNATQIAGHVEIEDHAYVSGLVGMHQYVRIGAYSMVGGMSRINKDVLPFSLVEGNPAVLRGMNIVGLRRKGIPRESIRKLSLAFDYLIRHDLKTALELIESNVEPDEYVEHLINFIRTSQRGVILRASR